MTEIMPKVISRFILFFKRAPPISQHLVISDRLSVSQGSSIGIDEKWEKGSFSERKGRHSNMFIVSLKDF